MRNKNPNFSFSKRPTSAVPGEHLSITFGNTPSTRKLGLKCLLQRCLQVTWEDSWTAALYSFGRGSWLAWASGTVAHYAAIHCQLNTRSSTTDILPPQMSVHLYCRLSIFTTDIYNVCFVIVTSLRIVTDGNKDTTYLLTYTFSQQKLSVRKVKPWLTICVDHLSTHNCVKKASSFCLEPWQRSIWHNPTLKWKLRIIGTVTIWWGWVGRLNLSSVWANSHTGSVGCIILKHILYRSAWVCSWWTLTGFWPQI